MKYEKLESYSDIEFGYFREPVTAHTHTLHPFKSYVIVVMKYVYCILYVMAHCKLAFIQRGL